MLYISQGKDCFPLSAFFDNNAKGRERLKGKRNGSPLRSEAVLSAKQRNCTLVQCSAERSENPPVPINERATYGVAFLWQANVSCSKASANLSHQLRANIAEICEVIN